MTPWLATLATVAVPVAAQTGNVLPEAVAGYESVCLASVPDFSGFHQRALNAGFQASDGILMLPNSAARVEVFSTEQGCACLTAMVAPDPNATAMAIIAATLAAGPDKVTSHPDRQITAVLEWHGDSIALQLERDTRGEVPMVHAYLLSQRPCPKN